MGNSTAGRPPSSLQIALTVAGEAVIGPRTRELAAGEVAAEPLGELRLDGLTRPVAAYRVRVDHG